MDRTGRRHSRGAARATYSPDATPPAPRACRCVARHAACARPSQPVEILRDAHGISHIYAKNEHDLFFAQGYVAASDRFFQLELWRRQATGTVAELLGPRELQRDIGARLFKFRGNMADGARALSPARRRDRARVRRRHQRLHRRTPSATRPSCRSSSGCSARSRADGRRRSSSRGIGGLLGNITEELTITRAVAAVGPDVVKQIENFHPGDPDLTHRSDDRCKSLLVGADPRAVPGLPRAAALSTGRRRSRQRATTQRASRRARARRRFRRTTTS